MTGSGKVAAPRKRNPRDKRELMSTLLMLLHLICPPLRAEEQIKREKERHERHLKRHLEREKGMLGDMRKK